MISETYTGTIPASIGNLSSLQSLNLAGNWIYGGSGLLYGTIPSTIGALTSLETLHAPPPRKQTEEGETTDVRLPPAAGAASYLVIS